jgi:phage-related protein
VNKKIREVIAYESHFKDFILKQPTKVQDKIFKIIELIEVFERIPKQYLKHIEGASGLYEARISFAKNTWRVFCFFEKNNTVILLNAFVKKSQKTPKKEILKAIRLKEKYNAEKLN